MGPAARRPTRTLWPRVAQNALPVAVSTTVAHFDASCIDTQTGETNVDAYLTWTLSPGGAVPAAVSCLDDFFQHSVELGPFCQVV